MSPDVSQPEFRLATSADAELLLDFMCDYYLFDGHRYEREPARAAAHCRAEAGAGNNWR